MLALAPSEDKKSIFNQIYIMDSTQKQAIYRYKFLPMIGLRLIRADTIFISELIKFFTEKSLAT